MAEVKKANEQLRDYKERFEFKLTVGDNIICQRYFKINNFNPLSLKSFELAQTIRDCASVINWDLKEKTQVYLEVFAPKIFKNKAEMEAYLANPYNASKMTPGEGIVLREGAVTNYVWSKNDEAVESSYKFDDGELVRDLTDVDKVDYKFAFCVDGREVCSTIWEGVYPKYIRNSIDLSNRRGKFDGEDITRLGFEQYLLYKMVEGRSDLVWNLIKDICYVCSSQDNSWYTISEVYENKDKFGNKTGEAKVYWNAPQSALNNKI